MIRPDDWHCHLRDGHYLEHTVPEIAKRFARVIVMPNLNPPITDWRQAEAYAARIKAVIPRDASLTPLMTLYLTEEMTPNQLIEAKASGIITACKYYPAHATTHSQFGVKKLALIYPLLEQMEKLNLPLLVHGEVTNPEVDVFDRELIFIDTHLTPLLKAFPNLRIVLEHISSKNAVDFVRAAPKNLAATITPHHLLLNRTDMLASGIRPHYYCAPVVKSQADQESLIAAATSGNPKFFLGTDSAPHVKSKKESSCGAAGIYSSCAGIEYYAELFERAGALDKLEDFASRFGAEFYQLPINQDTITLAKTPWSIPTELPFGNETVIPLLGGETLTWQLTV